MSHEQPDPMQPSVLEAVLARRITKQNIAGHERIRATKPVQLQYVSYVSKPRKERSHT